jgi:hypothetical protein
MTLGRDKPEVYWADVCWADVCWADVYWADICWAMLSKEYESNFTLVG